MASEPDHNHTNRRLEKPRHVKYWLRCLKTLLPHQYTSNESNRMYLGYFILSALDLLDALQTNTSDEERQGYIDWIYQCQHPHGGFRMWPGTCFGDRATPENAAWDPANVPGTYFALASLLILGDDLQRVKRRETLLWIRRMQRPDGSFGETLINSTIEGGRDPRFGFCIAGIRYILRGNSPPGTLTIDEGTAQDVNIDAFVSCVQAAESYDGGIADEAFHEPHAGYTFCSLGAMALLDRLPLSSSTTHTLQAPRDPDAVARWLASRQTDMIDPDDSYDSEFVQAPSHPDQSPSTFLPQLPSTQALHQPPSQTILPSSPFFPLAATTLAQPFSTTACAGMNGRTGKVADTCYAFWAGASLHLLQKPDFIHVAALQTYLLDETQHAMLGGFGKFPGDLPDLYHSYMGLAALSLVGHPDLKVLDASMCVSRDVRSRLPQIWERWEM